MRRSSGGGVKVSNKSSSTTVIISSVLPRLHQQLSVAGLIFVLPLLARALSILRVVQEEEQQNDKRNGAVNPLIYGRSRIFRSHAHNHGALFTLSDAAAAATVSRETYFVFELLLLPFLYSFSGVFCVSENRTRLV